MSLVGKEENGGGGSGDNNLVTEDDDGVRGQHAGRGDDDKGGWRRC